MHTECAPSLQAAMMYTQQYLGQDIQRAAAVEVDLLTESQTSSRAQSQTLPAAAALPACGHTAVGPGLPCCCGP